MATIENLKETYQNIIEELFLRNKRENDSETETSTLVTVGSGSLDKIIRVVFGKTFCCCQCKGQYLLNYTYLSLTH